MKESYRKMLKRMCEKISSQKYYDFLFYSVLVLYFLSLFLILFKKKCIGSFSSINLIPFRTINGYLFGKDIFLFDLFVTNIIGNIAIFVPMGMYIPLFAKRKSIIVNTILIMGISICAEIVQYIFTVGALDVDDVILNTIGGFCGGVVFKIFYWLYKDKTKEIITVLAPIGGVVAFFVFTIFYFI